MSTATVSPPAPELTSPVIERQGPPKWWGRPLDAATWLVLAAISYVPCLLTRPGQVAADTKQYLYLDPGRLIASTISMWDPDVGAGTVTHQNIGFLFPMGPYYWLVHELGHPDLGRPADLDGHLVLRGGHRRARARPPARSVALGRCRRRARPTCSRRTSIDYIARISAIVHALGGPRLDGGADGRWRCAGGAGATRRSSPWSIALVGGVNATSILLVALAPILWVVCAVWVTHEVPLGRAAAALARLGVLSALVSVWWVAGLWAEGAYGINVLRYTETIPTVDLHVVVL